MSFLGFWGRGLRHAFSRGWIAAGAVNFALSVLIPVLQRFDPRATQHDKLWALAADLVWELSVAAFILIVLGRIVYAPFLLYREREAAAAKTEQALMQDLQEERAKRAPELVGEIDQIRVGQREGTNDLGLFVLLKIRNLGAPTSIEGFGLHIATRSVARDNVRPSHIQAPMTFHAPNMLPIQPNEAIYEKEIYPLVSGGMVRGWLMYLLDGLRSDILREEDMNLAVKFSDVRGKEYIAKYDYSRLSGPSSDPMYYPGV